PRRRCGAVRTASSCCKRDRFTIQGPEGSAASSASFCQGSRTIRPHSSSGIGSLLEERCAEPPVGVAEAFIWDASREISVDYPRDNVNGFAFRQSGAEDLADRGVLLSATTERQLKELLALLVYAENPDVSIMVVTAGVDAAGDVDPQGTNLLL